MKAELPAAFDMHDHLFSDILLQWHDPTLQARELAYTVEEIVEALVFWRTHYWPVSCMYRIYKLLLLNVGWVFSFISINCKDPAAIGAFQ